MSDEEIVHFDLKYLETESTERSINESEEIEPETTIPDPEIKNTIEETKDSTPEDIMTEDPTSSLPPTNATSENKESMILKDEQSSTSEDEGSVQDDEVELVAENEVESINDEPLLVQEEKEEKNKLNSAESSPKSIPATIEKSTQKSTEISTESKTTNPSEPPQEAEVDKVTKNISKSKDQEPIKEDKEKAVNANKQETIKNKEASSEVVWLSVLGLLSFPIVAWSEWSLYQTGCGLPPGPGGLLGALEGIGYLVITGVTLLSLFQRLKGTSKRVSILTEASSGILVVFGLFVIISQVQNYGYIPSALPDQNCPAQPTEITVPMIFSK